MSLQPPIASVRAEACHWRVPETDIDRVVAPVGLAAIVGPLESFIF